MDFWKNLKGFKGYEINILGQVRNKKTNKIYKNNKDKNGYIRMTINYNGKIKNFLVHRLIAIHFIPNPLKLPNINHKDGIKNNNSIENLEWCTQKQNIIHAFRNKLSKIRKGEEIGKNKFKEKDILNIRKLGSNGVKHRIIAEKYNTSRSYINFILRGKIWKHVKQ
jgi:hypothetical protein